MNLNLQGLNMKARRMMARQTKDPQVLDELAEDEHWVVRKEVIENPNTWQRTITKIAGKERFFEVCEAISKSKRAPAEALEILSKIPVLDITINIAENPNTGKETLAKLANHEHLLVRMAVAENHNTTANILLQLINDKYWDVRIAAAKNPNIRGCDFGNTSIDIPIYLYSKVVNQ